MGQAKQRGSREQRIAQAQEAQLKEEPINVPCKTCKEPLNGFEFLKSTPAGAAWQKKCQCGAVTTALVQAKNSTLQRTFKATLGMTQDIVGQDKGKVSVSFLEKSVDTIETGLIRLP
ncbi:hypothetical protein [Burkholderia ubonensis]|uniref:hypothetical protein n=1 Tax=Burkholderia ubonensis TaxID=101571 RepID=UPI0007559206|nr:hypothetical protein [Burkholderia ubonensis]KVP17403.1 hypothetical protein WJ84_04000 [Burkholderia ubonensis]KVP39475.1 hypothetical protein WJ87_04370 [Burkholderia ubonensis]